jgi:hypothetical protein
MRVIVVATNPAAQELQALPSVIDVVSDFSVLEPACLVTMIGHTGEQRVVS